MEKKVKWLRKNFKLLEKNGDWEVWVNFPVYREIFAYGNFYIRNTETGENCGQHVVLCCTLFDENGNKLETPIYDKNCYEVVEGPNE